MRRNGLVEKTVNLYSEVGWKKWFSKIRFWDAPYEEVENLIPKSGTIVDLGCGEGIFTNFLALSSPKRKIIGVDIDKTRVKEADRGLSNASFKVADATKIKIPKCDAIVLFHLLHHLRSYKDQEVLLHRCINTSKHGGKLLIVEVDKTPFLKYLISWFVDHFIIAWLFEKKFYESNIFFRDRKGWVNLIKENGLKPSVISVSEGKPFSHIIIKVLKN